MEGRQSRETHKRSELAGCAASGWPAAFAVVLRCPALPAMHARGMPHVFCLASANERERENAEEMRNRAPQNGLLTAMSLDPKVHQYRSEPARIGHMSKKSSP